MSQDQTPAKKLRTDDVVKDDNKTEEVEEVQESEWKYLPHDILLLLLSYLNREDQFHAGLCCRNWLAAFQDPHNWNKVVLKFTNGNDSTLMNIQCLKQYGEHICRLSLQVAHHVKENEAGVARFMYELACLADRRLRELKLTFTKRDIKFPSQEFIQSLTALLKPAEKTTDEEPPATLTVLDLSQVNFSLTSQLQDLLAEHHPQLQYLDLYSEYAKCRANTESTTRLLKAARNLKVLKMHGSLLNDEGLLALAEEPKSKIRSLHLTFGQSDNGLTSPRNRDWEIVSQSLPELRVVLRFQETTPNNTVSAVLEAKIPCAQLHIDTFRPLEAVLNFASQNYSNHLETLVIHPAPSPQLDKAIMQLVARASNLSNLHVFCPLKLATVQQIHCLKPDFESFSLPVDVNEFQDPEFMEQFHLENIMMNNHLDDDLDPDSDNEDDIHAFPGQGIAHAVPAHPQPHDNPDLDSDDDDEEFQNVQEFEANPDVAEIQDDDEYLEPQVPIHAEDESDEDDEDYHEDAGVHMDIGDNDDEGGYQHDDDLDSGVDSEDDAHMFPEHAVFEHPQPHAGSGSDSDNYVDEEEENQYEDPNNIEDAHPEENGVAGYEFGHEIMPPAEVQQNAVEEYDVIVQDALNQLEQDYEEQAAENLNDEVADGVFINNHGQPNQNIPAAENQELHDLEEIEQAILAQIMIDSVLEAQYQNAPEESEEETENNDAQDQGHQNEMVEPEEEQNGADALQEQGSSPN